MQERRAQAYNQLRVAFSAYLHNDESANFRQVCAAHMILWASLHALRTLVPRQLVTATGSQFQQLSTRVRQLEQELREGCGRADLADVLDRVQAEERSKLQLTMNLQVRLGPCMAGRDGAIT